MRRARLLARSGLFGAAVALVTVVGATGGQAADFTIEDALAAADDVVLIEFTQPDGDFTAFTSSNDPANMLPSPIDSLLSLFAGTGGSALLIDQNDDALDPFSADVGGTTYAVGSTDSLIQQASLMAGSYTLGLSYFGNGTNGTTLAEGYTGGGNSGDFRVHLLGITELLNVQNPAPVSISEPPCEGLGCDGEGPPG